MTEKVVDNDRFSFDFLFNNDGVRSSGLRFRAFFVMEKNI